MSVTDPLLTEGRRDPYQSVPDVSLQPVAQPEDTFVRAQTPQDLTPNLNSLLRGLSEFDAGVSAFAQQRDDADQDAKDKAQAMVDAYKNPDGQAQGVQDGTIPAQHSKVYMDTLAQTQGQIAGDQLQQKFDSALRTSGVIESDDPNAFKTFQAGFIRDNVNATDPNTLIGLAPKLRQLTTDGFNTYTSLRNDYLKNKGVQATGAAYNQVGEAARLNGLQQPQGMNVDDAYTKAMSIRSQLLKGGLVDPTKADQQYVDAVTSLALQHPDEPGYMQLLDKPVPGTNYTFAQTPYGLDQKQKTQDSLDAIHNKNVHQGLELQKAQDDAYKKDMESRVMDAIVADPNKALPDNLMNDPRMNSISPMWKKDMLVARDAYLKAQGPTDPDAMLHLTQSVMAGGGRAAVNDAVQNGIIHNGDDYKKLVDMADVYDKNRTVVDGIMADPTYKSYQDTMQRQLAEKDSIANLNGLPGWNNDSLQLKSNMDQAILNWATNHPGATPQDRQKAINDIGQLYLAHIKRDPGSLDGGQRVPFTPKDTQMLQQITGGTPAPDAPFSGKGTAGHFGGLPPAPAPAPAGSPPGITPADRQSFLQGLKPEQQQQLQALAQKTGRSMDDVTNAAITSAMRQQGAKNQGVTPSLPAPAAPAPVTQNPFQESLAADAAQAPGSEDDPVSAAVLDKVKTAFQSALASPSASAPSSGNYQLATLKDDPKAAHLLDFVAGPESRGNYNAYFGHANNVADLSTMSMDQIKNWMDTRGTASSATGRYQFMKATLFGNPKTGAPGLVQRMGIKPTDKFTPLLQDQMAVQLLKDRGYDSWRKGQMSDSQFAENLAHEWASLPSFRTGQSVYQGDGLNKSLVSTDQVQGALDTARNLGPGTAPPTQNAALPPHNMVAGPGAPAVNEPHGPGGIYANIPDVDSKGRKGQVQKFLDWNPDPVGNQAKNLATLQPSLADVIRKAQEDNPGIKFVVASGRRDQAQEDIAVRNGWSPKSYAKGGGSESKHTSGAAVDLWPLDENGAVKFDPKLQGQVADAVKRAASQLGVGLNWGGDFKRNKDRPHFELIGA